MNKNTLIVGKGYLAKRLKEELSCQISGKRINTLKDVLGIIKKHKPKVIINCIGFTGKDNVDGCEADLEKTINSNTFVPILLAEGAIRNNIKLIHINTGCIYHYDYSKSRLVTEKKPPDYLDLYYSRTKIYSERALEALSSQHNILILRIRIPLDGRPHNKNLLSKLIKYKKVIDLPNSATYVPDFIKALKHLTKIDARGIYNLTNKGGLRYEKLLGIYKKYVPDFDFEVIPYKKLNMNRTNLILSTKKLEDSGFKVRHINDVLEECIKEYLS